MPLNIDPESHDMSDFDYSHPDFDCEPDAWKKCGACPTMIPNLGIGITKPGHRTLDGNELCSECSDLVTDAEQEAAEYERTCAEHAAEDAREAFRAWMAGGHA